MKKPLAVAALIGLMSAAGIPVAQADLSATLNARWDRPPDTVHSGDGLMANVEWDANYAHGFIDEAEPTSATFLITVDSGAFMALPDQCGDGSSLTPTRIECVLETPDDNGIAGSLPVAVRAQGSTGDQVSLTVTDPHGNVASTRKLDITAESGIDISLVPAAIHATNYVFHETIEATSAVPIMVSVPFGAEPLTGNVSLTLDVDTFVGPDVMENKASMSIVPVTAGATVTGVAANGENYEVPDVTVVEDGTQVTLTFPVPEAVVAPTVDGAGNALDTVPVASFALSFDYPVSDPVLDNDEISWSVEVVSFKAQTESGPVTEQVRTTNDRMQSSLVTMGSASAKFVNGRAPDAGGIIAVPGDDPADLPVVHSAVWDESLGTGVLSAGANHWLGRGPILPGDQMVGIINAAYYVGRSPSDYQPGTTHAYCLIFDRESGTTSYNGKYAVEELDKYTVEYLTGDIPGGFRAPDCGQGSWTEVEPDDPTAIRILFDPAEQAAPFEVRPLLGAGYLASEDLKEGERAWMSGGFTLDIDNKPWIMSSTSISQLPGSEYGATNSFRDAVEVVPSRTSVHLDASADSVLRGEEFSWLVDTQISAAPFADRGSDTVEHRLVLPAGVEYVDSPVDPTVAEEHGRQVLTWSSTVNVGDVKTSEIVAVHRTGTGTLEAEVSVENLTADYLTEDSDRATVVAEASSGTYLTKSTESDEFALDGSNRWTVTLENRDSQSVDVADTIDILPVEGDGRGTRTSADIAVTELAGGEVWVTSVDPADIDPDPLASSNGSIGRPSRMWDEWYGQDDVTAVRWISRNVGPGQKATYTIDYTVDGATNGDLLVNSAQTRTAGAKTTMINSSSSTTVGEPADLQVDKALIGSGSSLAAGEELTFAITVRGTGPGTVRGATVADIPITGLEDATFTEVSVGTADGAVWRIGDLPEDEIVTATVTATATGGPVENMLVGDVCDDDCVPVEPPACEPNVDVYSDTDRCDYVVLEEQPVLKVDKTLDGELPASGEASFTITVLNDAMPTDGVVTTATEVVATDLAGTGLDPETIAWSNLSQGSNDGASWMIGSLPAGEKVTAAVTGDLLPDAQRVVNAVSVRNPVLPRELTEPADAVPNETVEEDTDQADVVDISRPGRLAVNKEFVQLQDGSIEFLIEVGNLGGRTISDVVVVDVADPDLVNVVLSEPTSGTVDELSWLVGTLEPGQVEKVTVTATVAPDASEAINQVRADGEGFPHPGTFEPNPSLDTDTDQGDTVVVDIPRAELRLDKRVLSVNGGTINFEIEVCNIGTGPAGSVTVTDPGGVNLEKVDSDDERFQDGTFFLGELTAGQCQTLTAQGTATQSGTNVAFVDSPNDPFEEGSNQRNDSIEEDIDGWDEVDFEIVPPTPYPGELPLTGPNAVTVIVGGLGLLGLGVGLLLARRRA